MGHAPLKPQPDADATLSGRTLWSLAASLERDLLLCSALTGAGTRTHWWGAILTNSTRSITPISPPTSGYPNDAISPPTTPPALRPTAAPTLPEFRSLSSHGARYGRMRGSSGFLLPGGLFIAAGHFVERAPP